MRLRGVKRVATGAQVLVVDGMQGSAVCRTIDKAIRRNALGRQHHVAGHGKVAVQRFSHRDSRVQRLHDAGKPPDRNAAPALRDFINTSHRKEVPVVHGLTKGGVGDVVGGERKAVNAQPHLALAQRLVGRLPYFGAAELVFTNQKIQCVHGRPLNLT